MTPTKAGADWPDHVKQDFERNAFNGCVGDTLLSETDKVRVWKINLKPGERIGFHRHVLDYFWTAVTAGLARSHLHDGTTYEVSTVSARRNICISAKANTGCTTSKISAIRNSSSRRWNFWTASTNRCRFERAQAEGGRVVAVNPRRGSSP